MFFRIWWWRSAETLECWQIVFLQLRQMSRNSSICRDEGNIPASVTRLSAAGDCEGFFTAAPPSPPPYEVFMHSLRFWSAVCQRLLLLKSRWQPLIITQAERRGIPPAEISDRCASASTWRHHLLRPLFFSSIKCIRMCPPQAGDPKADCLRSALTQTAKIPTESYQILAENQMLYLLPQLCTSAARLFVQGINLLFSVLMLRLLGSLLLLRKSSSDRIQKPTFPLSIFLEFRDSHPVTRTGWINELCLLSDEWPSPCFSFEILLKDTRSTTQPLSTS